LKNDDAIVFPDGLIAKNLQFYKGFLMHVYRKNKFIEG